MSLRFALSIGRHNVCGGALKDGDSRGSMFFRYPEKVLQVSRPGPAQLRLRARLLVGLLGEGSPVAMAKWRPVRPL